MALLHLLRHGQHNLGGGVLAGRTPGVGLTERGRAEIAAACERLAGEHIAALYASPLQRTRESAEIVSERLGLPIEFRDDLIELDFGEWTGTTFDAIRDDPRWRPMEPAPQPVADSRRRDDARGAVPHGRGDSGDRRAPSATPLASLSATAT